MGIHVGTFTTAPIGLNYNADQPAEARRTGGGGDHVDREGAARAVAQPEAAITGDVKKMFANHARVAEQITHKALNNDNSVIDKSIAMATNHSGQLSGAAHMATGGLGALSLVGSIMNATSNVSKLKDAAEATQKLRDFAAGEIQDTRGIAKAIAAKGSKDIAQRDLVKSGINILKSSLIVLKSFVLGAGQVASIAGKSIPFLGAAAGIASGAVIARTMTKEAAKSNALSAAEATLRNNGEKFRLSEKDDTLRANMKELKKAASEIQQKRQNFNKFGLAMEGLNSVTGIALGVLSIVAVAATGGLAAPILALTITALVLGAGSAGENLNRLRMQNDHDKALQGTINQLSENPAEQVGNKAIDRALVAMNSMLDSALDTASPEVSERAQNALFTAARADETSDEGQAMRKLFTSLQGATAEQRPAIRRELLTAMAQRAI